MSNDKCLIDIRHFGMRPCSETDITAGFEPASGGSTPSEGTNKKIMHSYETHRRSLAKTIIWRVIATLITWGTIYLYTGQIGESTKITLVAAFVGMVAYYIYERIWNSINWGKLKNRIRDKKY